MWRHAGRAFDGDSSIPKVGEGSQDLSRGLSRTPTATPISPKSSSSSPSCLRNRSLALDASNPLLRRWTRRPNYPRWVEWRTSRTYAPSYSRTSIVDLQMITDRYAFAATVVRRRKRRGNVRSRRACLRRPCDFDASVFGRRSHRRAFDFHRGQCRIHPTESKQSSWRPHDAAGNPQRVSIRHVQNGSGPEGFFPEAARSSGVSVRSGQDR